MIVNIQTSWKDSNEHKACLLAGLECRVSEQLPHDAIGIGSVEYCRSLRSWPACDPYPDWLPWGRKIYRDHAPKIPLFYKPADVPKRFTGGVMETEPGGIWIASEIVTFIQEWRAYVINGFVRGVFCYSDFEQDYAPDFPWAIPGNVTAAIDFGITPDGRILPVEVNDPYAIGWYGRLSQYQLYADFVTAGWESMLARHRGEHESNQKRKRSNS